MIWDLQVSERDGVRVHRARLEPGEASPWHVDSFHRVSVVLQGEQLRIEYQDGGEPELVPVVAGQVTGTNPLPRASTGQLTAGSYHTRKLLLPSSDGREAPPVLAEGSPSTRVVVARGVGRP